MRRWFLVRFLAGAILFLSGCTKPTPAAAPAVRIAPTATTAPVIEEAEAEAEPEEDDADTTDGWLGACAPGSAETVAARKAIGATRDHVLALPHGAAPRAVEEEIAALLATPCFDLARRDLDFDIELRFASATSLKAWWADGGEDFLESYLSLVESRYAHVAPTIRSALVLEGRATHPLAPLLCPAASIDRGGCGNETSGWQRRATTAFERMAAANPRGDEEECKAEAKKAPRAQRYTTLRDCFARITTRRAALPLGRFKAPVDGWLVMGGDGASSRPCDAMRAYDLATGAAYVASACRGSTTVEVGRVPLGALREASFFLFFAGTVEARVRPQSQSYLLDADVAIGRPRNEVRHYHLYGVSGGQSSRRSFSWMRSDSGILKGRLSGTIAMPAHFPDAHAHASELLAIAEAGFEAGCAPVPPPASIAWAEGGPSVYGAAADFDRDVYEPQRTALARTRSPGKNCGILP